MKGSGKARRRRGRGTSGQLTYWEPPGPATVPEAEPAPRDPMHGFTLVDIHHAARCAAATSRTFFAADYAGRFEAAWHGVCERLLDGEPAAWHDLVRAGQHAVNRQVREEMRQHGYRDYGSTTRHGPGTMPGWVKYWSNPLHQATGTPEEKVTDRLAVTQILPRLTPRERQAVEALAACGDYDRAAAMLGMTEPAFVNAVFRARRRFLALWHEGETPSRPWRQDRRRVTRPPAACGTASGYQRHKKLREECDVCDTAMREIRRQRAGARRVAGEAA